MRTTKMIGLLIMLISNINVYAQRKMRESEQAFHELTNIRETFRRLPVQMDIELRNATDPVTSAHDTMRSKMHVYMDENKSYMEAEGLEQIVTDSLQVMVNHETRQIHLRRPAQGRGNHVSSSLFKSMPRLSYAQFKTKYTSRVNGEGANKTIRLQTKALLKGTNFPQEVLTITYNGVSYDPVSIASTKSRLTLIDSVSYSFLKGKPAYKDRLITVTSQKGSLFLVATEYSLTYKFDSIIHGVKAVIVRMEDRVVSSGNGRYLPANGYEQYTIYSEFK